MSTPETLHLPEPFVINKDIMKQMDYLEKKGETISSFMGLLTFEAIFYLYLIKKYNTKCIASGGPQTPGFRLIGITFNLKLTYTKQEKEDRENHFKNIAKKISECIKKGEQTILIPLTYLIKKGITAHANVLIYRRNTNVLEHFEPHGNEFMGNKKMQDSAAKNLREFTKMLNTELNEKGRPVKYVNATEVCPYLRGLQNLENQSYLKPVKGEPGGYCVPWSMFFAELCLKNPEMSSAQVLENIYNYLSINDDALTYLKKVIRGYTGHVVEIVNRYLKIFFKPDLTVADIINITNEKTEGNNSIRLKNLKRALEILVQIETDALLDPNFDLKIELKTAMKQYKNLTIGMSKRIQKHKILTTPRIQIAYYIKRILQNYEEYTNYGKITEPLLESPVELRPIKKANNYIIEKGVRSKLIEEQNAMFRTSIFLDEDDEDGEDLKSKTIKPSKTEKIKTLKLSKTKTVKEPKIVKPKTAKTAKTAKTRNSKTKKLNPTFISYDLPEANL